MSPETPGDTVQASPPTARMMEFYDGLRFAHLLSVIAGLGVADEVAAQPLPVDEIAARTGTHADALYRALRAVASEGVFTEVAPRVFGLTELAETLRSDVDGSLRDVFRLQEQPFMWSSYANLGSTLRTGEPSFEGIHDTDLYSYLSERPDLSKLFSSAMGEASHEVRRAAVDAYDLSRVRLLVDVGGGHGHLVAAMLSRYPQLRGVVFDLPHVVSAATAVLAAAGVSDRAEIVGGDYRSSLPAGGDAYLLSNVVHQMTDAEAVTVLRAIREVMDPAGQVIVLGVLIPEGNVPHTSKLLDITMMALSRGRFRTEAELTSLLAKADLRHVDTIERPAPASTVVAVPD